MPYQVSRNGQTYGPYTLEDLQRYVASGNIASTDLAKSEDMPDWIPVSQILNIPAPSSIAGQPYTPPANYQAPAIPYPDPPNLHWGIVLLIDFFTCGIFQIVWNIVIAAWAKKVDPSSKALLFFIIATVAVFANVRLVHRKRHGSHASHRRPSESHRRPHRYRQLGAPSYRPLQPP